MGEQLMAYISSFPCDIREILRSILQSKGQMYQVLLKIHQATSRSPTPVHTSDIRFTNVVGEYRGFSYEYFCQWEPFEGFLRGQFKGKPGNKKIADGRYHIIDLKDTSRAVAKNEHWNTFISEGAMITMSMIMSRLHRPSRNCPRSGCGDTSLAQCSFSHVTK